MRAALLAAIAAVAVASPIPANATTCEEFTARVIEGAGYYKMPVPTFERATINSYDADRRFFNITFGNVRALMKCNHGWVDTFDLDANDKKAKSTAYIASLIAISLYGYGWDWREATDLRDQLVREAKAPSQMAEHIIDDTKVSLIISFGGVASFAISPK